jgi:hypothetical protein
VRRVNSMKNPPLRDADSDSPSARRPPIVAERAACGLPEQATGYAAAKKIRG